MVKKSTDVKGGITKPKASKSSASKHATTAATESKPKNKSTKKDSASLTKGASGQDKSEKDTKKSKSSLEIDGLFGQLKGKATATAPAAPSDKSKKVKNDQQKSAPAKRPKIEGSKDDIFGTEVAQARKKTEEGYNIYKEDELGLGKKGGDTDKCPFDCDCCF